MHDVLHYDGCLTVRVAPSLRHSLAFASPHQEVRCLIGLFLTWFVVFKMGTRHHHLHRP
jgi:hypothetical protein